MLLIGNKKKIFLTVKYIFGFSPGSMFRKPGRTLKLIFLLKYRLHLTISKNIGILHKGINHDRWKI